MSELHGFTYFGKTPAGIEMALSLPVPAGTPQEIAAVLAQLDEALKAKGFTRSDRLEPRNGFGGGGGRPGIARPDDPPPPELVIPEHCEKPMRYKREKPAADGRKAVDARWECALGRDCAEAEERNGNRYPATNWHLTKKVEGATIPTNGTASKAMGYGDFKTAATQQFGMFTAQIVKFAGVKSEDELRALGPEKWLDLLDKMKAEKAAAAA